MKWPTGVAVAFVSDRGSDGAERAADQAAMPRRRLRRAAVPEVNATSWQGSPRSAAMAPHSTATRWRQIVEVLSRRHQGGGRRSQIVFSQVRAEKSCAELLRRSGHPRLAALVGKSKALLLAGSGTALSAVDAERIGLVDRVLPRDVFDSPDEGWRSIARSLARRPATEIKRVIRGVSADEAIASFARLWVADPHWQAAERVMNRNTNIAPAAGGAS